jgi:nucleoside-diphosphate-sugar epimerase
MPGDGEVASKVTRKVVVLGGLGLVGRRLVEMLAEADPMAEVVASDVGAAPVGLDATSNVSFVRADITDVQALMRLFEGASCVYHCAALVGPYHPHELYEKVNVAGTLNVIEACKAQQVPKLVMTATPSSRFDPDCGSHKVQHPGEKRPVSGPGLV